MQKLKSSKITLALISTLALIACESRPKPGPDKTIGGAVLGAAWGAGAGAVIGHQIPGNNLHEGMAVGAGFGLISGAMQGAGYDQIESQQIELENQLASLRLETAASTRELSRIQNSLDNSVVPIEAVGVQQVFFDSDATNLRAGSISQLEVFANNIRRANFRGVVRVDGHADDAGDVEYNNRLAEARARSVSSYLAARGISMDSIVVKSFGAKRPLLSNSTESGRQLNRRVDVYLARK